MRRFYLLLSLLLLGGSTIAAHPNFKQEAFKNYIQSNMRGWESIIDEAEKELSPTAENQLFILQLYYGLIGHYMDIHNKDKAKSLLNQADNIMDKIEKTDPNSPQLLGLKANLTGFDIAISPYKAPFIVGGMLSDSKASMKKGGDDPFVIVLYANILFYMPSIFGGDESEALSYYEKALGIMEKEPSYTDGNWLYIQLLTTIGLVYEKMGNYPKAQVALERVLKLEPNYKHVKDTVYPRLLAKMKK